MTRIYEHRPIGGDYPGQVERGYWDERPKPGHPGVIEREWISESDQRTRRAQPPSAFHYQQRRLRRSKQGPRASKQGTSAAKARAKPRPDWHLETRSDAESVELRVDREPELTITLRPSVQDALSAYARESDDGLETAGFLFGERVARWRKRFSVGWVTRMVEERRESSCVFDLPTLVAEKAAIRRAGSEMEEIGSWHTHPLSTDGTPSEQDLQTWLNSRDFLNRAFYFGLILTAKPQRERWVSDIHAWVVRREGVLERPVCEPARVVFS